jgi:hypothetical protein
MHRFRSGIAGIVLAVVLAGCGGSTVDEGPKGFTPTDTKPLESMLKEQQDVMKKKGYAQKPTLPDEKTSKEAGKKS